MNRHRHSGNRNNATAVMILTDKGDYMHTEKDADCTFTKKIGQQEFRVNVYFNNDSKETFHDKLLRVILAEEKTHPTEGN